MKDLGLIYINYVGTDYANKNVYEFLFSDDLETVGKVSEEWDWNVFPASGNPDVPDTEYVKAVGRLVTELKFDLVQESGSHSVWDSIDKVIAMGFENMFDYEEYETNRLVFHFGDTAENIINKLYERDENLKMDEIKDGLIKKLNKKSS